MAKQRKRRKDSFFGLHFDLHPGLRDTELGADCTDAMVEELIRRARPDYVQYDCKGHAGYTGYPSKVGWASPGIRKDALKVWRRVTARRGVALYIHYSGVWDNVAVKKRPQWARVNEKGKPDESMTSTFGPYVDKLLIPQLKEVAAAYDLDGVWVDGDSWAVRPDFSRAARQAFRRATGARKVPKGPKDPLWREFLEFHREQFKKYLAHYVDALHEFRPGFQVCCNWMFSSHAPDPVTVAVDFLSGDYSPGDSVNTARLEARYLASLGKPWDLMAWGFNKGENLGWQHKTAVHLKQEASVVLSQGGGFQIYYQPTRAGWFEPRLVGVMADVARFCRARKAVSFKTESVPQVALLHSAATYKDLTNQLYAPWQDERRAMQGMLYALLELGCSVDVLAEHQLTGRTSDYPLVVLPECTALPADFQKELEEYVRGGGSVLVIGARAARLMRRHLGVRMLGEPVEGGFYLDAGEMMVITEGLWQRVRPTAAKPVLWRYRTHDARKRAEVAATVARCGKGRIGAFFGPLGSVLRNCHHPVLRSALGMMVRRLFPSPTVELKGPPCVDMALRRKGQSLLIHLSNVANMQTSSRYAVIDFVPPVGPIELVVRLPRRPRTVRLVGENGRLEGRWQNGKLRLTLDRLDVHAVVAVE